MGGSFACCLQVLTRSNLGNRLGSDSFSPGVEVVSNGDAQYTACGTIVRSLYTLVGFNMALRN